MYNEYDQRIYAMGKGPSATTVSIMTNVVTDGDNVLVQGTVTDISPGTEQYALRARFPNGVPAVADEDMADWMEYVYMQKPCPDMVLGVPVQLTAYDSNGGMVDLGYVTSDGSGVYTKMWTPESEGEYRIVATFEGSRSYWTSYAETTIGVGPAQTTEPQEVNLTPLQDSINNQMTYILAILVIVIIALLIAIYSLLKKQK